MTVVAERERANEPAVGDDRPLLQTKEDVLAEIGRTMRDRGLPPIKAVLAVLESHEVSDEAMCAGAIVGYTQIAASGLSDSRRTLAGENKQHPNDNFRFASAESAEAARRPLKMTWSDADGGSRSLFQFRRKDAERHYLRFRAWRESSERRESFFADMLALFDKFPKADIVQEFPVKEQERLAELVREAFA